MSEKITPTPWWWEESDDFFQLFGGGAATVTLPNGETHTFAAHHMQIMKVPKRGTPYAEYWPNKAERDLMAASPAMYEALEAATALIEGWDAGATEQDMKRVVGLINNALARARGE